MAKVSVIIPVYNVEKYLKQCMESVMQQTLTDLQIICVDDGSTDKSGEILDGYAAVDCRILVIHKVNTGYGSTMNLGLDKALGDYIAVIESDDFAEPDMLEKLYLAAVESGAEITKSNHYNFREGQDYFCNWLKDFPKGRVFNSREYPKILYKASTIWTCLCKRDFLLTNGIRFHETPGASFQDISFALQCWLCAKKLYFIEDALLHYRNDNPNSSMHNPDKIFNVIDEYEWLEEKFKELWKSEPLLESYFVVAKYRDYLSHYNRIAAQFQYAFLLRVEEELKADMEAGRIEESIPESYLWKNILDLYQDKNAFFRKTAKDWADPKLGLCRFQNEESYKEELLKKLKSYPQLVLYGAGQVGRWLAGKLQERQIPITCFAVTKKEAVECMGTPVKELAEIKDLTETCAVVVAVAEKNQYELYQNLAAYGFQNVYRVDRIVRSI